jgi:predicted NodU family carbamoyl transferase
MNILSIHTSHDGCMTYVSKNKIIFHTQLDRYNRMKHYTFPTKNILNIIENLNIDKLIITHLEDNSTLLWRDVFQSSLKLRNIFNNNLIYYNNHHHLFHVYCALTWNKNIKNILICDCRGKKINNGYENESYYTFNNLILNHIITESNSIGEDYQAFTENFFKDPHALGKTMALSLYNSPAKKIQEKYEMKMNNLIKNFNIKKELLFSGGCAQNILFNNKILDNFKNVFCDPFNGDFGISLGAINYFLKNKIKNNKIYLGIKQNINTDLFLQFKILKVTPDDVAKILLNDPVAIFQSRSEQGQRGLGNRSLLMSPINKNANYKLNEIKKREWYRPFACSILYEKSKEWFDLKQLDESPYMMFAFKIKKNKKNVLKSGIAINDTSRIQTVKKSQNFHYYNLIKEFDKITNIPILINTSLNLPGEVLVETLYDMREMFINSNLKYIYLPEINKIICK